MRTRKPDGDPLIAIEDVADMNEILLVDSINERKARKAVERKAKMDRHASSKGRR